MSQPDVPEQAAALAARLVPRVPELARRVVERIRAEVPGFDRLPGEIQDVEVAGTARASIRAFLRHAQGLPGAGSALSRERAVQRAEEGIPLAALVQTYHVGAEVVVDALAAESRPDEAAAVLHLVREQLRAVGSAVTRVTEAYLAGGADQHVAVRELTWALLRGERPEDVAARYGLPLESGYLVLRVRAPGDGDPRVALRWVLARTAARAEGRALSLRDDLGGHVLLPPSFPLADLVRAAAPGRVPVVGVAPAATPADVPAAARRAGRIAAVAGTPGLHRLADVLLDYHLAQPGDGAAEVAAVLDPLVAHPDLLPTLTAWLGADLDRRGTARALGVHANTVDNRLERIAELTGVDPRSARGIQLFGAALALRRAPA